MIGWENNQGAYFVQKLQDQIDSSATDISGIEGDIGTMSNLKTTADTLVGGINEVVDEVGDISDLSTTATNLVGAVNEVNGILSDNHVYQAIGSFIKSKTGTTNTYGMAIVHKQGNYGYIDFECKVTADGTLSTVDVYMKPEYIKAINSDIPNFKVGGRGLVHFYTSTGSLNASLEGFAGCMQVSQSETDSWVLARVYDNSGNIGGFTESTFKTNMYLIGSVPIEFI